MSVQCEKCGWEYDESRESCPRCGKAKPVCLHVWIFDGLDIEKGKRMIRSRCMLCGAHRTDIPVARIPLDEDGRKYSGLLEED